MQRIDVRQAVLSDLDDLALLFDRYRQFKGRGADPLVVRSARRQRFEHGDSVLFTARAALAGYAQLYEPQ